MVKFNLGRQLNNNTKSNYLGGGKSNDHEPSHPVNNHSKSVVDSRHHYNNNRQLNRPNSALANLTDKALDFGSPSRPTKNRISLFRIGRLSSNNNNRRLSHINEQQEHNQQDPFNNNNNRSNKGGGSGSDYLNNSIGGLSIGVGAADTVGRLDNPIGDNNKEEKESFENIHGDIEKVVVEEKTTVGGGSTTKTNKKKQAKNDHIPIYYPTHKKKKKRKVKRTSVCESESGCDIAFLVGPDTSYLQRIPAHSWILMKTSPVFNAMFNTKFKENCSSVNVKGAANSSADTTSSSPIKKKDKSVVVVNDVDARAFDVLLRFMYKESIEIKSVGTALTTLYAAHKYLCPRLAKIAVRYLKENLNAQNVLQVVHNAQLFCPSSEESASSTSNNKGQALSTTSAKSPLNDDNDNINTRRQYFSNFVWDGDAILDTNFTYDVGINEEDIDDTGANWQDDILNEIITSEPTETVIGSNVNHLQSDKNVLLKTDNTTDYDDEDNMEDLSEGERRRLFAECDINDETASSPVPQSSDRETGRGNLLPSGETSSLLPHYSTTETLKLSGLDDDDETDDGIELNDQSSTPAVAAHPSLIDQLSDDDLKSFEMGISVPHFDGKGGRVLINCCTSLMKDCYDLIDLEISDVLLSEDFEDADLSVIKSVISRNTLNILSELEIYRALLRWSSRECKKQRLEITHHNRRHVLSGTQYLVRYLTLTYEELTESVDATLLTHHEYDSLVALKSNEGSQSSERGEKTTILQLMSAPLSVTLPDHLIEMQRVMRSKRQYVPRGGPQSRANDLNNTPSSKMKRMLTARRLLSKSSAGLCWKKQASCDVDDTLKGKYINGEKRKAAMERARMASLNIEKDKFVIMEQSKRAKDKFNLMEEMFVCLACIFD